MTKTIAKYSKLLLVTAAFSAAAIPAFAHDTDRKDNITRDFDLTGFSEIDVSGVYELEITAGKEFSVVLTGAEQEMDNLKIHVEDGILYMGGKKKWRKGERHGIEAVITLPKLSGIEVSGVASGNIKNVDADSFELDVSGVAEVNIEGRCGSLDAHVSGVGELNAEDLICKDVEVHLSGVGEVSVHATDFADITASGMGEVDVYGDPKRVKKDKSFFTSIDIH